MVGENMPKTSIRSRFPVASGFAERALLFAIPVVLASSGCQDGVMPNPLASQVRDSAGIQIVENARPADESRLPWRIGPEPTVSIGEVTGEEAYLLHGVEDGEILPDGRIVIANTGTSEIRVFDASGVHQATWGRAGAGPGEFTALGGVGSWPGDFPGTRREELTYTLRDGHGSALVSLGVHPGREWHLNMEGQFPVMGLLPFSRSVHEASWDEGVILAPDDHCEIRVHDRTTGALARIVRRDDTNRAPTRDEVDQAIDEALGRTNLTGDQLEWTREAYKGMPLVESFPAFRALLTDALNHLWVREATLPGMDRPTPLWTVFDPEGLVLGFIETPDGLTILEIGADYILGHATDDLGAESVQVWPLDRSGG